MIIVTGEDGWLRNGGGGGQIIGNVIIAPYNLRDYVPENLSTTFLSPKYEIKRIVAGRSHTSVFLEYNAVHPTGQDNIASRMQHSPSKTY